MNSVNNSGSYACRENAVLKGGTEEDGAAGGSERSSNPEQRLLFFFFHFLSVFHKPVSKTSQLINTRPLTTGSSTRCRCSISLIMRSNLPAPMSRCCEPVSSFMRINGTMPAAKEYKRVGARLKVTE